MKFDADGPYDFSSSTVGNAITSKALKLWFRDHRVGGSRGVYIVVSGLKKPRPWYVGLAAKQTFVAECTTNDKINKINKALQLIGRGQPAFLFLAVANGRKKPTALQSKAIDALETEMIRGASPEISFSSTIGRSCPPRHHTCPESCVPGRGSHPPTRSISAQCLALADSGH